MKTTAFALYNLDNAGWLKKAWVQRFQEAKDALPTFAPNDKPTKLIKQITRRNPPPF